MDNIYIKQLNKLESLAEIKFKEIEKEKYNKYYHIYDIAIEFLKNRKDVLLYGGTAINEVLPNNSKIYGEFELPDIDIFTPNSKKLIKSIISHYTKNYNEINLVSSSEALHENTYKIYAEGLQILDVTELPKNDFAFLYKNSLNTKLGIKSVGINFIKFTLHLLSSQSYDSYRWNKVYDRLLKIYKYYPPGKKQINWKEFYNNDNDIPSEIYTKFTNWINTNKLLSFGINTIEDYIKKPKNINGYPVIYLLFDGDLSIFDSLDKDIKVSSKKKGGSFIESYYDISYKKFKIGYIFKSESCYSIISKNNTIKLTLHSIVCLLYKLYLSTKEEDESSIFIPIIDKLSKIIISYSNNMGKFKELYSSECYGHQMGLITLRRNKIIRQRQNKNIFTK
jgi:hypothetical protein